MTTLLVIEADTRVAEFVQRGFAAEGYLVDVASRGREALQLAGSSPFHLIVLAFELPDISGLEVCGRLRANGVKTPLLATSTLDTVDDKVRGLRMGADDYVTKPFAFAELLARVEALLRRGSGLDQAPNEIVMSDLTLNRERREVHRGGVRIPLTPREFALLEFLMRSPGKVFSRTRLLEGVWGYHSDPLTNVVEVCVRNLRRKVDANHAAPLIQTVRGFGYRIEGTEQRADNGKASWREVCGRHR